MARDVGKALVVEGLVPLQKALKRAEGSADKELRKSIREAVKPVLSAARANAPVGPRPKRSNTPQLKGSIRLSVTTRGASVYSNAAHAYVQDRGGIVGRGAIIPRARASAYMTRAVAENRPETKRRLENVLDRIADDFQK